MMMKTIFYVCVLMLSLSVVSKATTITYTTPNGSITTGGPVDASATFVTGDGTLVITLSDLQTNPKDVAQLVSDLDFVLSTGQTIGSMLSSSGQEIMVTSGGTFTLGNNVSTGWGLDEFGRRRSSIRCTWLRRTGAFADRTSRQRWQLQRR